MSYIKHPNVNTLEQAELLHLNAFLFKLIRFSSTRAVQIIYRGDTLENLHDKLGVHYDAENIEYQQLLSRLFMVGEKARSFFCETYFDFNRSSTIGLNDFSEKVFQYIFDSLNSAIKSKNTYTVNFFDKNEDFKKFFGKKTNKKEFLSKIELIKESERLYARNYYLVLLHQLGSIRYKEKSHFTSSTTNYSVAQQFSKNNNTQKEVIIHAWSAHSELKRKLNRHHLPVYVGNPYSNQREVSIFAGILPHYIIGLEVTTENTFFINPNLFVNSVSKSTIMDGFNIDQDNFDEILKLTNYKTSFLTNGGVTSERNRVN